MKHTISDTAATTVAYADVFDAVLTTEEAVFWAAGRMTRFPDAVRKTDRVIRGRTTYVTMRGRAHLVAERVRRERIAVSKWKSVTRIAAAFRFVPTLLLVGVTGGLSMNNARQEDDIDLFFVARRGTLWVTRLMVTLIAELFGTRRRPGDFTVKDKVCLNMFVAEDDLTLPVAERDLFAAHEVLQMKPLWEREDAYARFLRANSWVQRYLPNAWKGKAAALPSRHNERRSRFLSLFYLLEPLVKYVQLRYMNRRRTNEIIRKGQIRFHPTDARLWVRERLANRLKAWDIPLDSVFYHR